MMTKIVYLNKSSDCAVRKSLSAIKQAQTQFDLLPGMCTPTILASRIELCDVLLVEIALIRSSLAKDIKHTRGAPQAGHIGLNS